jgi:hypothetical protein
MCVGCCGRDRVLTPVGYVGFYSSLLLLFFFFSLTCLCRQPCLLLPLGHSCNRHPSLPHTCTMRSRTAAESSRLELHHVTRDSSARTQPSNAAALVSASAPSMAQQIPGSSASQPMYYYSGYSLPPYMFSGMGLPPGLSPAFQTHQAHTHGLALPPGLALAPSYSYAPAGGAWRHFHDLSSHCSGSPALL